MSKKPKVFGSLVAEVIRKDRCVFCGACVASCTEDVLLMKEERPVITSRCSLCETCYYQCPRVAFSGEEIEKAVFDRKRSGDEKSLGVHKSCYAARSLQEEVLRACQDGGAVSSLLAYALREGKVDCAVVAGVDEVKPWKPRPEVVMSYKGLVDNAGTKYTPSPTVTGLKSAVDEHHKNRVALVATPCQVQALRRMQTSEQGPEELSSAIELVVGLFCMEVYSYDALREHLEGRGIDLTRVSRFEIKKGRLFVYDGDRILLEERLREIAALVRPACHSCADFSAEYADISVGNIGSPEGWSTVIPRTNKGERTLLEAEEAGFLQLRPLREVKPGLKAVIKLSNIKKSGQS